MILRLKQDRTTYCTTMLDYFGLGEGFPETPVDPRQPAVVKAKQIEQALGENLRAEIGELRPDLRFVPYIQVHEYEALLFSDPEAFASAIRQPQLAVPLRKVRDEFRTPEDIDDGPESAPSKRVLGLYAAYRKVLDGTAAAGAVGIGAMRRECPHFDEWLRTLEALSPIGQGATGRNSA